MANKKLLICAAIATGLLLTACVKKEEPKNEEQQSEQSTETQITEQQPESVETNQQFETLESVDTEEAPAPSVETMREETENTTTEIRRETRPAQSQSNSTPTETSRTESARPAQTEQNAPSTEQPKALKPSGPSQSEEDAVAAAIAAATPALNN